MVNIEPIGMVGFSDNTCLNSRHSASITLSTQLSKNIEVWMDDTIRQVEKDVCKDWSQKY